MLRYELVTRYTQDPALPSQEKRRVVSEHQVLCSGCGERVLDALRSALFITVTTQTRARVRIASA